MWENHLFVSVIAAFVSYNSLIHSFIHLLSCYFKSFCWYSVLDIFFVFVNEPLWSD